MRFTACFEEMDGSSLRGGDSGAVEGYEGCEGAYWDEDVVEEVGVYGGGAESVVDCDSCDEGRGSRGCLKSGLMSWGMRTMVMVLWCCGVV